MAKLKKYNLQGKETGEAEISDAIAEATATGQSIKDYIVAIRNNQRQWSACTRDRSEVNHTGKKPHKQKGLGRARQGSLASPQYRGGGVVFGPRPKFDQHVRINRKERRSAVRALLGEKIREQRIHVLEDTAMDAPKTKNMIAFLGALGLSGRVLLVGEGNSLTTTTEGKEHTVSARTPKHGNLVLSLRNIPKVQFSLTQNMSGQDVALAKDIVITEAALAELQELA